MLQILLSIFDLLVIPHILKLRVAEEETKKAIQFIDESQVLVTESLPFGGDADPTLAMDLSGDALPHSVHDMMQRGEAASSSGEKPGDGKDGKDGPLDQHMDDQPVARLAIKTYIWFSMLYGVLLCVCTIPAKVIKIDQRLCFRCFCL